MRSRWQAGWRQIVVRVWLAGATAAAVVSCRNVAASDEAARESDRSPWLWGRLQRGPYAVGLRLVVAVDSTRAEPATDGPSPARPLELLVWYPARDERLTHRPVVFGTYVDLSDGAMADSVPVRSRQRRRRWLAESVSRAPGSVSTQLLDRILDSPMAAVTDAPAIHDRVPAILWSPRHATPAAQSVLSEYLASHGYVVAWVRYAGRDSLLPPYDGVSVERKAATLEAHVADMQWALRRLAALPFVDSSRLGVAAWSYAGEPARVLAQRTPGVRVIIGLSTNFFVPTYHVVDVAASLDSAPLRTDVILAEETGAARGQPRDVPALLDRLPGKVYRASFASLAHGNFNVLEGMIPGLTGIDAVQPWSIGGPRAQAGYETVCRAVVALLDKTLNGAPGDADGWRTANVRRSGDPGPVALVRHGPGRDVSSVRGTQFVDERIVLASDGWRLAANFVRPSLPGRVPAVLMLNKANGDRRVYADLARQLAGRGIASLRLDVRGAGESTNRGTFVPGVPNDALRNEDHDVSVALGWLRSRATVDASRIAVVGASYTGESMAVAERAGVKAQAYVALSPGSLSIETIAAIDTGGAPWWILRSRDERFVRDVVDSVRARSRSARVTEVTGSAHATDILVTHPEIAADIAEWLSRALSSVRSGN